MTVRQKFGRNLQYQSGYNPGSNREYTLRTKSEMADSLVENVSARILVGKEFLKAKQLPGGQFGPMIHFRDSVKHISTIICMKSIPKFILTAQ